MIDPLPIKIIYKDMSLFKDISNITYSEDADISIFDHPINTNELRKNKYNIGYYPLASIAYSFNEVWVDTLEDKINLSKNRIKNEIVVLTKNKELLPYCMKDRLVFLQDKINKIKGRYG